MKIKGIEGLTVIELQDEINQGGKFVIYQYCISILVMSFKRPSDIYFVRKDGNRLTKGLPFSLVSFLLGWWGIPWGIIYTFGSLGTNFGGGKDVTGDVMRFIHVQTNGPVFDFEKEVTTQEEEELKQLAK